MTPKSNENRSIFLDYELLTSRAFLSLKTVTATKVYMIFMTKRQMKKVRGRDFEIANNYQIVFTYDEAVKLLNISKSTFTRAIDELIEKGLIDVAATGKGLHKIPTLYGMSERWRAYGTDQFEVRTRPIGPKGRGFQPGNHYGRNSRHKQ